MADEERPEAGVPALEGADGAEPEHHPEDVRQHRLEKLQAMRDAGVDA